jgi:pyridinium-3,5-bisthiocarboxylic acid mononucleotide nickel chelatase
LAPDAYDIDTVTVIEANIDNMNPEFFDHVMTRLLESGAVDVFMTPIQMKRNRPATMLSVLAPTESVDGALDILFAETTTLGVRTYEMRRRKLPRQEITVTLPGGRIRVKVATLRGAVKNVAPEYVDCREIAEETGEPIKSVYDEAKAAALKALARG